ncbi:MAG: MBL fold metallo-hydrolase [Bacillota bacterium]
MRVCWHGSCSYSLELGGVELLVDPSFSRLGDYGPWFIPNPGAPDFSAYAAAHRPEAVLISHGHFDHFDLETVRRLEKAFSPRFCGSGAVTDTIARHFQVPRERLLSLADGESLGLAQGLAVTALAGQHWYTGSAGDEAAAKLDRPERYGVMPCGGPMLAFKLEGASATAYLSGDNMLDGIPALSVDLAVLCIGGPARDAVTGQLTYSILRPQELPLAAKRLGARVVVPVHYDFGMLGSSDCSEVPAELPVGVRLLVPRYNEWVDLG